ncbi:MAG: hypothetical protein V4726_00620 [Verrucomicrobiota bacterium]
MKRFPLIIFSGIAGLAAGFGLSALRQPGGAESGTAGIPAAGGQAGKPGAPSKPAGPAASVLAEKLRTDLSISRGVTRWLQWMTAVEKAGPGDFPGLARMAKEMPGALNMLAARWIELDPRGLFEACRNAGGSGPGFPANELAQLLLETWPKNDPDAVLTALKNSPGLQMGWQFTALNSLFQNRPEQALITMSALSIDGYGPDMKGVAKWAAADPGHAAEVALAHPAGFASRLVLETIGKEWGKSDPEGALAFAVSRNTAAASDLANQVMRQWVEKDLTKASGWLAAAGGPERALLLPAFIEAWGKKDAPEALQWCLANTSGSQQSEVITSLVKGTIAQSPDAAAAMIVGLEPSPLRSKAAVTFADTMINKDWWPGFNSSGRSAKPEAIAWLGQLDPDARKQVIGNIHWSWSEHDPRGFADYLRSPAGQVAGPEAVTAAARNLVREQPVEAIEWANQAPEASRAQTLSETFQAWTRHQPDAAMDWLQKLPSGDPRREALYLGAVEHIIDPAAFQTGPLTSLEPINNARRDLARLLATDPAAARQAIAKLSMEPARREQTLARLKLSPAGK